MLQTWVFLSTLYVSPTGFVQSFMALVSTFVILGACWKGRMRHFANGAGHCRRWLCWCPPSNSQGSGQTLPHPPYLPASTHS